MKYKYKKTIIIFCSIISIFILNNLILIEKCYSQEVTLKNGRTVQGNIVDLGEDYLIMQLPVSNGEAKIKIYFSEIEKINGINISEISKQLNFPQEVCPWEDLTQGNQSENINLEEVQQLLSNLTNLTNLTQENLDFSGMPLSAQTIQNNNLNINLAETVKNYEQAIEYVRNKNYRTYVDYQILNREQLLELLEDKLYQEYSPENIEEEKSLFVYLGLIDPQIDYFRFLTSLLSQQIAGLYEPGEDKIFIVDEFAESIGQMPNEIIIHELVHGLQDQYWDLSVLESDLKDASLDYSLAVKAVMEGEAMYVASLAVKQIVNSGSDQGNLLSQLANNEKLLNIMRQTMYAIGPSMFPDEAQKLFPIIIFPYQYGEKFIASCYQQGGWQQVDRLYSALPVSTEQILHPEKYFQNEQPLGLEYINLSELEKDFNNKWEGTLGEFGFYVFFSQYLPIKDALAISSGWGNDRYYFFTNGYSQIFINQSRWDTIIDAQEFWQGIESLFQKRYPDMYFASQQGQMKGQTKDKCVYVFFQQKDTIVFIDGKDVDCEAVANKIKANNNYF